MDTLLTETWFAAQAVDHSTLNPPLKAELAARLRRGDLHPEEIKRAAETYEWFAHVLINEYRRLKEYRR